MPAKVRALIEIYGVGCGYPIEFHLVYVERDESPVGVLETRALDVACSEDADPEAMAHQVGLIVDELRNPATLRNLHKQAT